MNIVIFMLLVILAFVIPKSLDLILNRLDESSKNTTIVQCFINNGKTAIQIILLALADFIYPREVDIKTVLICVPILFTVYSFADILDNKKRTSKRT